MPNRIIVCSLLVAACSSDPPPAPATPVTYAATPVPAPAPAPTPAVAPSTPPPARTSSTGGTAQAFDAQLASMTSMPLALYAQTEAPGMTKQGEPVAGTFKTGDTLEGQFAFEPGKCYTLVAEGYGVTELDIALDYVTFVPGVNLHIADDTQKGSRASIGGGKGKCLKPLSPFQTSARFTLKARTGAGTAAAQLFVQ